MSDPPALRRRDRIRRWSWVPILGLLAVAVFAYRLAAEPEFPDEWAYVSQAFYLDLLAHPDDPRWLEYPAYDLPPLPKYAIGVALKAGGYRLPPPSAARHWYENIKARSGTRAMLVAARWPSVLLGALGCLCVYALGTMAADRRVGFLAAGLLILDPLYRMQARRAMSDVPEEALLLAAAAMGLWAWRWVLEGRMRPAIGVLVYLAAGVLGGLAVLAKLNGGLAPMILGAWALLAAALPGVAWRKKGTILLATAGAGVVAYAVFVPLNPFLWSRPAGALPEPMRELAREGVLGRTVRLIEHRDAVSDLARRTFPHNALNSAAERAGAVVVQGFGRFGPLGRKRLVADLYDPGRRVYGFDSTIRRDGYQDRGALLWFPLVAAGAAWSAIQGRRQLRAGRAPTSWALLTQAALSVGTVTLYIPMAWDRYFLPIQAPACLLGASVLVMAFDTLAGRFRGPAPREP